MLVKEGMTRDICCLVGVKGFYGSFFFLPPPLSPISEDLKPKQCCVFVLPDMLYLVLSLSQAAANTCARFPQITHSSMHHHHHPPPLRPTLRERGYVADSFREQEWSAVKRIVLPALSRTRRRLKGPESHFESFMSRSITLMRSSLYLKLNVEFRERS